MVLWKNKGASSLYSLDDFDKKKIKTTTPYAAWYDEGRFGGVPDINYLKVASFISGDISLVMPDIDVKELSDGFLKSLTGIFLMSKNMEIIRKSHK